MRRRRSAVRTILGTVLLLTAASVSNASLEASCYVEGGHFGSTYFAANYLDETCDPGDPPSPVTGSTKHQHLFRFGDTM